MIDENYTPSIEKLQKLTVPFYWLSEEWYREKIRIVEWWFEFFKKELAKPFDAEWKLYLRRFKNEHESELKSLRADLSNLRQGLYPASFYAK